MKIRTALADQIHERQQPGFVRCEACPLTRPVTVADYPTAFCEKTKMILRAMRRIIWYSVRVDRYDPSRKFELWIFTACSEFPGVATQGTAKRGKASFYATSLRSFIRALTLRDEPFSGIGIRIPKRKMPPRGRNGIFVIWQRSVFRGLR